MAVALDAHLCEKYLKDGARIAVALSGGADSVCLLTLLSEAASERDITLFALHMNHCIRGAEADRDEDFCRELCEGLKIRLITCREDVPALARASGQSLEEAARNARYAFFCKEMEREGISVLATAHNADDNAETVLLRLIRGTSLDGICGIRSERTLREGMTVIRPILNISKRDILAYCEKNAVRYVTDSTNACIDYPRNRIRARVLPEAEAIDPAFLSVVRRSCEVLSRDADFINAEADRLYGLCADGERLSVLPLIGAHRSLSSRVVMRFCITQGARPERRHVEAICDAIEQGGSLAISIPSGMRVLIDGGYLYACPDVRRKSARVSERDGYHIPLRMGDNEYTDGKITVRITLSEIADGEGITECEEYFKDSEYIYTLSTTKTLKSDTIKGDLFARSRGTGDSIDFGSFHKDLRRAMSERHVPQPLRAHVPVICDGEGILYAPTVGVKYGSDGKGHGRLCVAVTVKVVCGKTV